MNVDELWRGLGRTEQLPTAAIAASLEHWDAASPRFLSKLRAFASGAKLSETDRDALFFVIHMAAEKHDSRAYSPLCEVLTRDDDVEGWLGDGVSLTLPKVLINLYDGDPEPLKRVIEAESADEFSRVAALSALAYLVRSQGALSDDEMRVYLREFGASHVAEGAFELAEAWAMMIGALGYETLKADVARAMSKGFVDPEAYDIKDFHADLQTARATPEGLAVFESVGVGPFESTLEAFADWQWGESDEPFDEESDADGEDDVGAASTDPQLPIVNPLRDVGRNDPCPCGSGKKFKKCCLTA